MKNGPNLLLTFSAAVYFVAAIPLLFAPAELCRYFDAGAGEGYNVLLQALGSALLGFAMLNWSNRFSRLGGVFGRPIIMANLNGALRCGEAVNPALHRTANAAR